MDEPIVSPQYPPQPEGQPVLSSDQTPGVPAPAARIPSRFGTLPVPALVVLVILAFAGTWILYRTSTSKAVVAVPENSPRQPATEAMIMGTPSARLTASPTQRPASRLTGVTGDPAAYLVAAHNALGIRLLTAMYANPDPKDAGQSGNLFISPPSISIALSMVHDGARTLACAELDSALGFTGHTSDEIASDSMRMLSRMTSRKGVTLETADAVWINTGVSDRVRIQPGYVTRMNDFYAAQVTGMDFALPGAGKRINAWVADKTHGTIPSIVEENLKPTVVLYLLNAVYFNAAWAPAYAFDPAATVAGPFTTEQGRTVTVPFMTNSQRYAYQKNTLFEAVRIPYVSENGGYELSVYLPSKGSLGAFMKKLSGNGFTQWDAAWQERSGTLTIPKLTITQSYDLPGQLKRLGLRTSLCDGGNEGGDFSGIVTPDSQAICIGSVVHKTALKLSEEGTEASAVTAVGMPIAGGGESLEPFTMTVNSPFVVTIRDTGINQLVFVGLIRTPGGGT